MFHLICALRKAFGGMKTIRQLYQKFPNAGSLVLNKLPATYQISESPMEVMPEPVLNPAQTLKGIPLDEHIDIRKRLQVFGLNQP